MNPDPGNQWAEKPLSVRLTQIKRQWINLGPQQLLMLDNLILSAEYLQEQLAMKNEPAPSVPSATLGAFATVLTDTLRAAAEFPITDKANMDAVNIRALCKLMLETAKPSALSEIAPKSSTSWRDQVEGAMWDENHSGHYILARDMAAILDRQALPSARVEKPGCICQGGNTQPYCEYCTPPSEVR